MLKNALALATIVLPLAALNARAAEPPSPGEAEAALHKRWLVEPGTPVRYLDQQGKAISFDEFSTQLKARAAVSKTTVDKAVVFQLQRPMTEEERAAAMKSMNTAKIKPGEPLPDFTLTGLDDKRYDKAALAGRVTVISFFFEACAPCVAEVPALNRFRELHPELNLVAVTFDKRDRAERYLSRHKLSWPILFDSREFNTAIGVTSYPAFAVLDADGRLLGYRVMGKTPTPDEAAGRAEHGELAAWVKELTAKSRKPG